VRWKEFHSLVRKAYLVEPSMIFGGVGMSKVSHCGRPYWKSLRRHRKAPTIWEWLAWDWWHLHKLIHCGWKDSTLTCAIRSTHTNSSTIHTTTITKYKKSCLPWSLYIQINKDLSWRLIHFTWTPLNIFGVDDARR